ncbi:MAG: L,D-transpeptidase [Gammaproteobacteria bacterium]|nr:L,D-transpeptidase [Gammaproteobacteria bacterium]
MADVIRKSTLLALVFAFLAAGSVLARPYDGVWVRVDIAAERTEVWRGEEQVMAFDGVAFGRGGASRLRLRGGKETPLGSFQINRINRESQFHIFLGINYPTMSHFSEARALGIIDDKEFSASIEYASRTGNLPQDGSLGGYIGLHGIGRGDPDIHQRFHWTQGCIAMTNSEIEELAEWVGIGTPVIIE